MSQEIKANPDHVQKEFDEFIDSMPAGLKGYAHDQTIKQFMWGAFLAGYRRGMSKTLAKVEKILKKA